MKDVKIPDDVRSWDRYGAFHCAANKGWSFSGTSHYGVGSPIILFDTGELICTMAEYGPDFRGEYTQVGIELTTTKDLTLYLPNGQRVVKAWLDDSGMQYLFHDLETRTAVRTDGGYRNPPSGHGATSPITPGIPYRFQYNCRAYVPGPGMQPLSHNKIKVKRPLRNVGYSTEQLEHIHMIVATGQAAMRLTNHEALKKPFTGSADPQILLRCKTWMDVPESHLPNLARIGCTHQVDQYDSLSTTGL